MSPRTAWPEAPPPPSPLAHLELGHNFLGLGPLLAENIEDDAVVELELAYSVVAAAIANNIHPYAIVNRVLDD